MTFIDCNIPMYLIGEPHPNKTDAQILVERLIAARERLVTDAEVLQEILHRYAAIGRKEAIGPAVDLTLELVDEVFDVEKSDVLRASEILCGAGMFSARDALHIAIMERHEVRSVLTFDADFDRWPGLRRVRR
ncbi:MAG TPA: type II toxin-antitoxin system VapC family toxin [Bryobacteraceae bacterium]